MTNAVSRRSLLKTGACALAVTAAFPGAESAYTGTGSSTTNEEIIRKYYKAWEKKDWGALEVLLADDFTFTSAAPDDHISKSAYKAQCWDSQAALIQSFDLERVFLDGDEGVVRAVCWTKSGKSFRNLEYFRFKNRKVESVECFFGGPGFPSAANKGQG